MEDPAKAGTSTLPKVLLLRWRLGCQHPQTSTRLWGSQSADCGRTVQATPSRPAPPLSASTGRLAVPAPFLRGRSSGERMGLPAHPHS